MDRSCRWFRIVKLQALAYTTFLGLVIYIVLSNRFGSCHDRHLPPKPASRLERSIDAFNSYAYRNHTSCNISSLDLHTPFEPSCNTRQEFLTSFTGGGRIGMNAPFQPRGCDMHWYSTEDICEIFSRFERVIVVGDSMMRHVVGALNVLLRKDLGYGAVTNWNFDQEELYAMAHNSDSDHKLTLLADEVASATHNSQSSPALCKAFTRPHQSSNTIQTPSAVISPSTSPSK
jgi:hypothetical protein